jgi:hypothetical protein
MTWAVRLELSAHLNASTASVHEHPADWRYQPREAAPSSAVNSLAKIEAEWKIWSRLTHDLLSLRQFKISWPGSFSVRRPFQRSAFSFCT